MSMRELEERGEKYEEAEGSRIAFKPMRESRISHLNKILDLFAYGD